MGFLVPKGSSITKDPRCSVRMGERSSRAGTGEVSPKQGGSPHLTSCQLLTSTSPMMNGPSPACRLSQWDSRGETFPWWRSWQGLGRAQQDPPTACTIPNRISHPVLPPPATGTEPGSPPPANQAVAWPGSGLCCSAFWGLPCKGCTGHLSHSLPPTPSGCCLVQGQKWGDFPLSPILSAPDSRGQPITKC